MSLYPLKFTPIIKDYLWGGSKLKELLHKNIETETAAESWEVSGVSGAISVVENGSLKGQSLQQLIDTYGASFLGKHVYERFGSDFPILVKFIDAKKDLSIQLHPNDELARKRHNCYGKNEMWHVMQAEPGAELVIGFNRDMNKEEFRRALDEGTLMELMNKETPTPGDTYFIKTGKVHAIGGGILLAEIQQTSNITYRVYDYNRKDKDGQERELHTELALDAIEYSRKDDFHINYSTRENRVNKMVESPYFITNFLNLTGPVKMEVEQRDSFHIYICTQGQATFVVGGENYQLQMGETLLMPACIAAFEVSSEGAKILEVHL